MKRTVVAAVLCLLVALLAVAHAQSFQCSVNIDANGTLSGQCAGAPTATPAQAPTPVPTCVITIASPAQGAVISGQVPIVLNETPACGSTSRISITGWKESNHFDFSGPSYTWNSTTWPDGPYTLQATAWSGDLNLGTSPNLGVSLNNTSASMPTTPSLGPSPTPTPASDPPNATANINYGQITSTASPLMFGVNGLFDSVITASQLKNTFGITILRKDFFPDRTVPRTQPNSDSCAPAGTGMTAGIYECELAAGCPSGSVCNTSTWNIPASNIPMMQQARAAGMKVLTIISYNNTWNGGEYGLPTDYAVYQDIIKKFLGLFTPDYIEIWNEPDEAMFGGLSAGQYGVLYSYAAAAIRQVNSSVPIGGPVLAQPNNAYVNAMYADAPSSSIDFISEHHYIGTPKTWDTSMLTNARSYNSSIQEFVSEWNYDGNCSDSLSDNDPASVPYLAGQLSIAIQQAQQGILGTMLYSLGPSTSTTACASVVNDSYLNKQYDYYLMGNVLGLSAGTFSVVSDTSGGGLTTTLGAINSAGKPVAVLTNMSGSPITVAVTMSGVPYSGAVTVSYYEVDAGANKAQAPISATPYDAVGDQLSFDVQMNADSVAGLILTPTGS